MSKYALRALEKKDALRMTELMTDEGTTKYLQIGGKDYTIEKAQEFIASTKDEAQNLHRAVVDENGNYMGSVSLKHIDHEKKEAEYAIALHPDAQGKGAASVATSEILKVAFDQLGLMHVYLNVLADNERANRFYKKFGFCYTHTSEMLFHGEKKALNWYEATCRR